MTVTRLAFASWVLRDPMCRLLFTIVQSLVQRVRKVHSLALQNEQQILCAINRFPREEDLQLLAGVRWAICHVSPSLVLNEKLKTVEQTAACSNRLEPLLDPKQRASSPQGIAPLRRYRRIN